MSLNTDEAGMKQAANDFDMHAADLKTEVKAADSVANDLVSRLRGNTGDTVQAQLTRYRETQQPLISELDTISGNIRESGLNYGSTDSDGASMVNSSFQV
ncbi:WXG repeat protein [Mycobacteroides abscessus subsp. bolletii]|uniref:WXG100 family type VII secretion target n=1 Tax=Mycobacteroides abscessus TaxID=36809 RepID=UPI0009A658BE|nr:WXG100 family type VII secretion target [Mycobacteroides abscessus]SKY98399.1 WXG repeat protein [Mycobacteroides abscessus subsp. bolletii]